MTDPTSMLDRAGEFCMDAKRIMRHPMRARGWWLAVGLAISTNAAADPKPKPIDIKPFRDQMIVLTDTDGALYIAVPGKDSKLFYGSGGKTKTFYEQTVRGRSTNGDAWDISVWAPRVPNVQPGSVSKQADGTYMRWCGNDSKTPLTEITGDKAK